MSFLKFESFTNESISPERITAYKQKHDKLKKEADAAMKKYERLMSSSNTDEMDEAYDEMIAALEKFMDHKKMAP